ncbi:sporulation protein YjcZ [Aliivibrio fischeri]|nr:sporulation protein YjcZ [Aliivibrio fischeri]MUK32606.1 sporulation protein YjcZ [Aliivibrio fischeri]
MKGSHLFSLMIILFITLIIVI